MPTAHDAIWTTILIKIFFFWTDGPMNLPRHKASNRPTDIIKSTDTKVHNNHHHHHHQNLLV